MRLPLFILQGFFSWLQPEHLFAVNIWVFSRYNYSPTISSHRKVTPKLQKKPTPKKNLRFFNPVKTPGWEGCYIPSSIQYWHVIPSQGHCKIFVNHVKSCFGDQHFVWHVCCQRVLCSSSLSMGPGVHAGALPGLWHSSPTYTLIKLFAQSPPVSSDVELHLWCVLTAISPLRRGWDVLFTLLCGKRYEQEDKGLEHVSESI